MHNRLFFKDLNPQNFSAGLVAGVLAITGPPALILQAAQSGSFTMSQTVMWMCSVYVFGGIFSIILPLYYRMPIVGAHSITGIAFLVTVTNQLSYPVLIGSYLFSGLLMLAIGYFGIFAKLMEYVPKEIIAAMLAGMITTYMTNFVLSIYEMPLIGGISILVYLLFSKSRTRIPPMIAAIVTGFILLLLTHPLPVTEISIGFILPQIQIPQFSAFSFISVSVPLALIILSNDAAVGLGALQQNGFDPPINKVILFSGLFSMLAGLFGGQSANVAGMMSAICSDEQAGPKEKRYIGAIISGVIITAFGILSWKLIPIIQILPKDFSKLLVGFALLGVFCNSLYLSFHESKAKMSAALTFLIALSNITILGISSPVWALVAGTFISRYIEK